MFGKGRSDKNQVGTSADILDPDALCAMSNTEILKEIEKLMAPPPGEDIDTDKVEQYLALLQERAPVMEDYDPAAQWDKLVEDHPLLFEETAELETLPSAKPTRSAGQRGGGFRLLRVAAVAVAVMFLFVVTANALGFNPIQALLKWADGVIQLYSNPCGVMELPAEDPSEYHTLEEALAANGMDTSGCPTWVPRDYRLSLVTARTSDDAIICTATYESNRGELIVRVYQQDMKNTALTVEREDGGYEYPYNQVEYYIVSNYELSKAIWEAGSNFHVISGQISEDELKEMIHSITHKE